MCGGSDIFRKALLSTLKPGATYHATIIKHDNGHEAFCTPADQKKQIDQIKQNLKATEANIVSEITGLREQIVFTVKSMNQKENLPGIYAKIIQAA